MVHADRYRQIGRNLRAAREAADLSQDELGGKLGVRGATIGRYESGEIKVSIEDLERIAAILGTTVDRLLARNDGERIPIQFYNLNRVPEEDRPKLRKAIEALIRQFEEEDGEDDDEA